MPRPPSNGAITSPFGMRIHPLTNTLRMHYGSDRIGAGNVATVTGIITFIGYHVASGFGNVILIREDATGIVWAVAHHASFAPGLAVGQRITEGTYTGPLGSTGAASGPHSHTERRTGSNGQPLSGAATNPELYYAGGAGAGGITPIRKRDNMSINAAGRTSDGSIYVQFEPGCPFLPISSLDEWNAYAAATGASYVQWPNSNVVKKYGTSTDFTKLAPSTVVASVSIDGITVPADPALLEAVKANTAVLTQLLAATKSLNPPG